MWVSDRCVCPTHKGFRLRFFYFDLFSFVLAFIVFPFFTWYSPVCKNDERASFFEKAKSFLQSGSFLVCLNCEAAKPSKALEGWHLMCLFFEFQSHWNWTAWNSIRISWRNIETKQQPGRRNEKRKFIKKTRKSLSTTPTEKELSPGRLGKRRFYARGKKQKKEPKYFCFSEPKPSLFVLGSKRFRRKVRSKIISFLLRSTSRQAQKFKLVRTFGLP